MNSIVAHLKRGPSTDQGTIGVLTVPCFGFSCFTMEPPWRNNQSQISSIPVGEYQVKIRQSPRYGRIFHLTDVQGRSYILIHWGNFGGDKTLGWLSHTMGCILLGKSRGFIKNQLAVINSRIIISEFMQLMNNQQFKLIIS